jgi:hypothetical protein
MVMVQMSLSAQKATCLPSGESAGAAIPLTGRGFGLSWCAPVATSITSILVLPTAQAILVPSGDQAGS